MKIAQYDIKVKDPELQDFVADVRNILNNGLYTPTIVSTVPSGGGDEGQEIVVSNGDFVSKYLYVNGVWRSIEAGHEQGWGYVLISGTPAYQIATLTFARTYTKAPFVRLTAIGATTVLPTTPGDIGGANTLRAWQSYAPTTTNCSIVVYSTSGGTLNNNDYECFSYEVVPVP